MNDANSRYKSILGAVGILGGLQVFNIIMAIVRTKAVAVLLGPTGFGLIALFMSTIGVIQRMSSMGLNISAVRNLAAANASENSIRIARYYKALTRLMLVTGLIGAGFTFLLSPWLSQLTFGNNSYAIPFAWISISILFSQISSGYFTVFQGLQRYTLLAKATLMGSSVGLIIGLPLYYWFGMDAVVPNILIASFVSLMFARFYVHKIDFVPLKMSVKRTLVVGRDMVHFGFILNVTAMITLAQTYIIQIYISNNSGSLDQVGFYMAGINLVTTYAGLVFAAISLDYYPRLTKVANSRRKFNQTINEQTEIILLLIVPLVGFFLISIDYLILLLYSEDFIAIKSMLQWAVVGLVPSVFVLSLATTILAKGDKKIWFWSESAMNVYTVGFAIVGYNSLGLEGIGIAYLISKTLHAIQAYIIARTKYLFIFTYESKKIFSISLIFVIGSFLFVAFDLGELYYFFAIILFVFSCAYSGVEINKRIDILSILSKAFIRLK